MKYYGAMIAHDKHEIVRHLYKKGVSISEIANIMKYTEQYVQKLISPHNPKKSKVQPVNWKTVGIDYEWRK